MSLQANGLYEFGPYRLDAAQRLLTRGDESVVLTPKTFDLLLILVESRGRVLTKKHLMDALWRDTFVDEANLPFQISALRRALGEEGAEWIETLPRHGYRFTAAVTNVGADGAGADAIEDPSPPWTLRRIAPWLIAGVTTLVAVTVVVLYLRQTPPTERTVRFSVSPPERTVLSDRTLPSVSPDGERVAFGAMEQDGKTRIWVRALASLTAEPVAGTEGAVDIFWSPDGRSLGFFAGGKLKKTDLHGGPPKTLCEASDIFRPGGTWSREGVILFNSLDRRGLYRVTETGGDASPVTTLDSSHQETMHLWPQFLPDGRHFLYFVQSTQQEHTGIYAGSLDSKESKRVLNTSGNLAFARSPSAIGYLLFMEGTTLMGQPFDAGTLKSHSEPFPVAEQAWLLPASAPGYAAFSASGNGVLAYRTGGPATELVWFDRQGKRLGTVGEPADYSNLALSRDEKKLAVCRRDPQTGTRDLWLFDLARGTPSRFTFDPADEQNPVWSPDGSQIVFSSNRKGPRGIYQRAASGTGEAELLLESSEGHSPVDWSPDGRFILYSGGGMLPLDGDRKPVGPLPIGNNPQVSPNGRWVAYSSNESGRAEVQVRSFPPSGGKFQVTTAGGEEPRWRADGKELFFISGNRLLAVEVKTDVQVFEWETPRSLFELRLEAETRRSRYEVASNGQRFLVNVPVETPSPPITVVVNWTAGLKLK